MNEEDDDNTRWIDRQHIATVVVVMHRICFNCFSYSCIFRRFKCYVSTSSPPFFVWWLCVRPSCLI